MDNLAKAVAAQLQARLRMEEFLGRKFLNLPPDALPRLQVSPVEMRPGTAIFPREKPENAPSARRDFSAVPEELSPTGQPAPRPAENSPRPRVIADKPLATPDGTAARRDNAAQFATSPAPLSRPADYTPLNRGTHVAQTLPLLTGTPEQITAAQGEFNEVLHCEQCGLCQSRRQVVFGEGNLQAELMFISEAPGKDEDFLGRPFISTSGELLTDIIEKGMKIARRDVFITNILKCRPPGSRDPQENETAACLPFLARQITLIKPRIIVAVGRLAGNLLTGQNKAPGELRGQWFNYQDIPLMTVYHPAFLLRERRSLGRGNRYDKETWADVQNIMRRLAQLRSRV